jgi:hypothetical protein
VVYNQSYSSMMQQIASGATTGRGTIAPYALPKVPSVVGSRVDGSITPQKQGSMIILPVRDKTLEVWTESTSFLDDFNKNILPNMSFSP